MSLNGSTADDEDSDISSTIHASIGKVLNRRLQKIADIHYGGSRSHALRNAIPILEQYHDVESNQGIEDHTEAELEELKESIEGLRMQMKSVMELAENLERGSSAPEFPSSDVSQEALDDVHETLLAADRRLTPDGLIERTNLRLGDLALALQKLIDETEVKEKETSGDTIPRYGITGAKYNEDESNRDNVN